MLLLIDDKVDDTHRSRLLSVCSYPGRRRRLQPRGAGGVGRLGGEGEAELAGGEGAELGLGAVQLQVEPPLEGVEALGLGGAGGVELPELR